ncbi:MAG: YhcH/YjgK/YiaL family protein [Bacteroidales bacterium]|nr:YhcH/YjgK/YiaL family protein [Bacteroidales bacterium]
MIITSTADFGRYARLHPLFATVHKELMSNSLYLFEERIALDGERLYASPTRSMGRTTAEAKLEAHNRYIDVQVCLGGVEQIGWRDRSTCREVASPYTAEGDIVFFGDAPSMYITLKPGQLAVFFPCDAHAPLIGDGWIEKVVFKVKI